jgi:hypothetical protein
MHGGIKNFAASFAASLGAVHGNIGVPKQVFRVSANGSAQRDPDTCGDYDFISLYGKGRCQPAL